MTQPLNPNLSQRAFKWATVVRVYAIVLFWILLLFAFLGMAVEVDNACGSSSFGPEDCNLLLERPLLLPALAAFVGYLFIIGAVLMMAEYVRSRSVGPDSPGSQLFSPGSAAATAPPRAQRVVYGTLGTGSSAALSRTWSRVTLFEYSSSGSATEIAKASLDELQVDESPGTQVQLPNGETFASSSRADLDQFLSGTASEN